MACCPNSLITGFNILAYMLWLSAFFMPYWTSYESSIGDKSIHGGWLQYCVDECESVDWSEDEIEEQLTAAFAFGCITLVTSLVYLIVQVCHCTDKISSAAVVAIAGGVNYWSAELCTGLYFTHMVDLYADNDDTGPFDVLGPSYYMSSFAGVIWFVLWINHLCDCCGCCGGTKGGGGGGGAGGYGQNYGKGGGNQMNGKNMPQFNQYAQWS